MRCSWDLFLQLSNSIWMFYKQFNSNQSGCAVQEQIECIHIHIYYVCMKMQAIKQIARYLLRCCCRRRRRRRRRFRCCCAFFSLSPSLFDSFTQLQHLRCNRCKMIIIIVTFAAIGFASFRATAFSVHSFVMFHGKRRDTGVRKHTFVKFCL